MEGGRENAHLEHLDDFVGDSHDPDDGDGEAHSASRQLRSPRLASPCEDGYEDASRETGCTDGQEPPSFILHTVYAPVSSGVSARDRWG